MGSESFTGPTSKQTWLPLTQGDKAQVLAELERVLGAPAFQRGGRYAALLRHVVECTLDGRAADLKERLIGMEVFHRSADYDTAADPVVRFCAGEVRKRLALSYRNASGTGIEIELPVGSYVPLFRMEAKSIANPDTGAALPGHGEHADQPILDGPASHPSFFRILFWGWKWLSVSLTVVLLCAVAILAKSAIHSGPLDTVWTPFLNKAVAVNICTGSPPPESDGAAGTQDISVEQHYIRSEHRVSMATAGVIADLSGFLEGHNQPFELSEATAESMDNFRNKPLILVDANNNPWTLFLLKPLRFHFQFSDAYGSIVDTEHPERHDWSVGFNQPFQQQTEDFAIVARLFDKTIGAPVLVVAGISSNGTKAAGEFIVSKQDLKELAEGAPRRWRTMNFEAVLKVDVVQGHMGPIQIVSKTFW